jgi:hypothetical protein
MLRLAGMPMLKYGTHAYAPQRYESDTDQVEPRPGLGAGPAPEGSGASKAGGTEQGMVAQPPRKKAPNTSATATRMQRT